MRAEKRPEQSISADKTMRHGKDLHYPTPPTPAALPREWSWSLEPATLDHMYRQSEPPDMGRFRPYSSQLNGNVSYRTLPKPSFLFLLASNAGVVPHSPLYWTEFL